MKVTPEMIETYRTTGPHLAIVNAKELEVRLEAMLNMPEVREALLAEEPARKYVIVEPMTEGAEVLDVDGSLWVRGRYGWHIAPIGTNATAAWDYVMKYAPLRRIR